MDFIRYPGTRYYMILIYEVDSIERNGIIYRSGRSYPIHRTVTQPWLGQLGLG